MSKLLNQVSGNETKVAYQTYTIQHGIEAISIQIPLVNAKVFEEQFTSSKTEQKSALLLLVNQLGGKVRTVK